MTPEQDEILKEWKGRNVKDPREVILNYKWLCRSLLGDGVEVRSHSQPTLVFASATREFLANDKDRVSLPDTRTHSQPRFP